MPNQSHIKSYLELHFIILIWGFTAVLGKLISLEAISLVWYRLALALPFLLAWIVYKKIPLTISSKKPTKIRHRRFNNCTPLGCVFYGN